MPKQSASSLPEPVRARYRPPIAKRVPANDHPRSWAGRGHVGAFVVQLTALVTVNLALWGFFAWWAMRYAERKLPVLPPGTGPL